ncbi:MAG: polymer-forming cytoskeletal protein [Spirochaetales bacterium]|nr:polymer-forming cytoskeletal protein [Spirochaetales bacterium]
MAFYSAEDVSINTIIGPGTRINGELSVAGFVRVDGDVDGNVDTAGRVIVGENARIRGSVHGKEITVGGVIQGDVIAPEGVRILSSGMVLGDVLTKKLLVEESVILNGRCFAVNNVQEFEAALSDYRNRMALSDTAFSFLHSPGSGSA